MLGEDNSIIIIDNASVHWGSSDDQVKHELIAMVAAKGGRVFFTRKTRNNILLLSKYLHITSEALSPPGRSLVVTSGP